MHPILHVAARQHGHLPELNFGSVGSYTATKSIDAICRPKVKHTTLYLNPGLMSAKDPGPVDHGLLL